MTLNAAIQFHFDKVKPCRRHSIKQVPASYRREMLDKQAIVKDLLAGISVPGCKAAWTLRRKEECNEANT